LVRRSAAAISPRVSRGCAATSRSRSPATSSGLSAMPAARALSVATRRSRDVSTVPWVAVGATGPVKGALPSRTSTLSTSRA